MLERAPAREEPSPAEAQPVQLAAAFADRVRDAVAEGSGQVAAAQLLATELEHVLSPEWDLAGVKVLPDGDGLPLFEVLLTDSGQWMRQDDLPASFHGFPIRAAFAGKTTPLVSPRGPVARGLRREMWDDLAKAALREAASQKAAEYAERMPEPCPGCDGCGRIHPLSAIVCATCGGSGRAIDKMVVRPDGSVHSVLR